MNIVHSLLNFLFPHHCLSCRKEGVIVCENCLSTIPREHVTPIPDILTVFEYRHPLMKKLVWNLKYSNKRDIATILAVPLYDELLAEVSERKLFSGFTNPILIPIPLSASGMKKRGYNQSALVVKALVELDKERTFSAHLTCLRKTKETINQAKIKNRKKRLANMKGAFSVKEKDQIRGRNIILIDDITTTGATINEAKKVLLKAGAREVIGFTLAH
jgi:competence protein ComFC